MNPAAIKANAKWVRPDAIIIFDKDNFTDKNLERAGYVADPVGGKAL